MIPGWLGITLLQGGIRTTRNFSQSLRRKPCRADCRCEGESSTLNEEMMEQADPMPQYHATPDIVPKSLNISEHKAAGDQPEKAETLEQELISNEMEHPIRRGTLLRLILEQDSTSGEFESSLDTSVGTIPPAAKFKHTVSKQPMLKQKPRFLYRLKGQRGRRFRRLPPDSEKKLPSGLKAHAKSDRGEKIESSSHTSLKTLSSFDVFAVHKVERIRKPENASLRMKSCATGSITLRPGFIVSHSQQCNRSWHFQTLVW